VRQTTEIQTVSHGAVFSPPPLEVVACRRRHSRVSLDVVITENGVRLRLNIVDTPGYGDQVNNENWQVSLTFLFASREKWVLTKRVVNVVAGTQL
jgi:septin family protein